MGSAPASQAGECTAQTAVEQWLRLGGRHIDTAEDATYFGAQAAVGKAIKASGIPRKEIFITTKIQGPIGKQQAIDAIKGKALQELGVDYIDLVLIHMPCKEIWLFPNNCGSLEAAARADTFQGLLELKKEGIIRAAGVSNWNLVQLAEFQGKSDLPAVNQVQWHLGYHDDKLLQTMKASNVTMMAWGSLDGKTPSEHHSPGVPLSDPRLKTLAGKYKISTAQLALRWEVQKGIVPVTFTCNSDHAAQDLSAFGSKLEDADMSYLDSLKPAAGDKFTLV